MINSLELGKFRRGREVFVFVAALASAMTVELLLRGNWQAAATALIAILCIRPIRERPQSTGPWITALCGATGIAFWLAIRFGMPAIMRGLA